jgi:hypothetical protein
MDDLRYPIGPFTPDPAPTSDKRRAWIASLSEAPALLRRAVTGLSDAQLDTPYRPGGWTVRQVVHHVPDSHMNAYIRLKLALTEATPTIRPYDEAAWALVADSLRTPVTTSLTLLEALHARWVTVLESMRDDDFARSLIHPERGLLDLDWLLQQYAWHGVHHAAHITKLREREGW